MNTFPSSDNCSATYEEKKSKFIALATHVASVEGFRERFDQIKKDYADARHIAYAYRIFSHDQWFCRFHDAGEPSGTAGKPIFAHLEGKNLVNAAVFVVRYFGGIKLGAGGLVRAYGAATRLVLDVVPIVPYKELVSLELELKYDQLSKLERLLPLFEGEIVGREFTNLLKVTLSLPKMHVDKFLAEFQNPYGKTF